MHIEAVIPAAGRSRRMGRAKMLLPLGETTVIQQTVNSMLLDRVSRVWIVTSSCDESVARLFHSAEKVSCLVNEERDGDMLSSVRCGLAAVSAAARGIILLPGDMPLISRQLVDLLIRCFTEQPETITLPICRGRRGHPVILPSRFRDTVMTSLDGQGLRGLLEACPDQIQKVETDDVSIFLDMDTPKDYAFIRSRFDRGRQQLDAFINSRQGKLSNV